jgi:RHS repeat-associated protein
MKLSRTAGELPVMLCRFARHFVTFLLSLGVFILSLVHSAASAQGVPYQELPAPKWQVAIPGSPDPELYESADAACRRQHQHFNPNAPYLPPFYSAWNYVNCNWDMTDPNAGYILPAWVWMVCEQGGLAPPGRCITKSRDANCVCEDGASNVAAMGPTIIGNPVALNFGAKIERVDDYQTSDGLFGVTRQYRSRPRNAETRRFVNEIPGFGPHWHGVVPGRLNAGGDNGGQLEYMSPSGNLYYFFNTDFWNNGNFAWTNNASNRLKVSMVTTPTSDRYAFFSQEAAIQNGPAEMRIDWANGEYVLFRRAGTYSGEAGGIRHLVPIEKGFPSGYKLFFDYPDTGEYPNIVRDSFGRQMTLTWTEPDWNNNIVYASGRPAKVITGITLPDTTRLVYSYGFGSSGTSSARRDRLESVSRQTAVGAQLWGQSYLYEDSRFPYSLTGIRDQNNARLSTYAYDAGNLVTLTERAGGVGRHTIENTHEPNYYNTHYRKVTNPLGRRQDYVFDFHGKAYASSAMTLTTITGQATANVPADAQTFWHDVGAGGYMDAVLTTARDPRGHDYNILGDAQKRPDTIREALGTASQRNTGMSWHSTFDLPTREERTGLRIEYGYSASGQMVSRTETDTTTHTLPYSTTGQVRSWTYDWNSNGRLLSVNGPKPVTGGKDDTETFTYDTAGNLLTSTNGLGHVTTFAGHDANGRPATMTDPNGIITGFTYDALGRVTAINVKHPTTAANDAITAIEYDVEGRVIGVTPPVTDKMIIDYNLAGQMTAVRAASGERIDFTYNAMSNVTGETVKRSNGTTARAITRTFDELGRMLTETLGTGRTTSWSYDKNGNATQIVSARSNATQAAFDPLNRLVSTVAPDTGTTSQTLDAWDNLSSFTDPVSVQTTFVRNGFGEVIQEVSPDRGTTVYYYDQAGDLVARTDGRGQRVDITRDILGRITSKVPLGRPTSETVTISWDANGLGSWQKGRLTKVVDGSGTTLFQYDHRGNMLTKRQAIGTTTAANLTYAYDKADRITQITYPSGRIVGYVRDTKGRVTTVRTKASSSVSTWTNLATSIQYEAFGSLKQATLSNTLSMTNDWGNDGRLASRRLYKTSGGVNLSLLSYGYDNDDNITAISDSVDPTKSVTYGYDALNRLTQSVAASGAVKRQDLLLDKNGNRTAVEYRTNAGDATPVATDSYTRTSGTNRLASVTSAAGSRTITYDGRGNTDTETRPGGISVAVAYDGHGRLISYTRTSDLSQTNSYNGLDDRVVMVSGSTTRRFIYDKDGRVLGEYGTSATNVIGETIWWSPEVDEPNQPFGGDDGVSGYAPIAVVDGTTINWIHGSHLGVPIVTTDATGTAVTPGTHTALGFPGQLRTFADLYYNRYRDYDPTTGRYIQADPIGLEGGDNVYQYADGNPLRFFDPHGLNAAAIRGAAAGGKLLGEGLWFICQRFPRECMATIGGAAVWVASVIEPECPTILEMGKTSRRTAKERSTELPSFAKPWFPDPDENCAEFAKNVMDAQYGAGNWSKSGKQAREFSQIKKNCERNNRGR